MRPEKRRAGRRIRKARREMRRISEGLVALGNAATVNAEAFVAFGAMLSQGLERAREEQERKLSKRAPEEQS